MTTGHTMWNLYHPGLQKLCFPLEEQQGSIFSRSKRSNYRGASYENQDAFMSWSSSRSLFQLFLLFALFTQYLQTSQPAVYLIPPNSHMPFPSPRHFINGSVTPTSLSKVYVCNLCHAAPYACKHLCSTLRWDPTLLPWALPVSLSLSWETESG